MKILLLMSLTVIGLTGCGSDSGNGGDDNVSTVVGNQVEAIASRAEDDEAWAIEDVSTMEADIETLFNGQDSAPVLVEPDDNIQDVISRAGGF